MSNKVKAGDYKNLEYLVKSYSVSYQSIYSFEELVEKNKQYSSIKIYRNIAYTGLEAQKMKDLTQTKIRKLLNLPDAQKEKDNDIATDVIDKKDSVVTLEYLKSIDSILSTPDINKDTSQLVIEGTNPYNRHGTLANIGLSCEDEIRYKFMMMYYSMPQNEGRKLLQATKLKLIEEGNTPYVWAGWVLFGF